MKDLKSDAFGILIAFFIPGIIAFYGLSFFSSDIHEIFRTFLTADANVGLFLLVTFGGLALGLQIALFRWVLFEKWICSESTIPPENFKNIDTKLNSFRAAIDEHYRYHQFYGAMLFIIPEYCAGLLLSNWYDWNSFQIVSLIIFTIVIMILNFYSSVESYNTLIKRANQILK